MELSCQFFGNFFRAQRFTLPDSEYSPTQLFKIDLIPMISSHVVIQLLVPELSVGLGPPCFLATLVLMPEAAMNEDYSFVLRKHDVGSAG